MNQKFDPPGASDLQTVVGTCPKRGHNHPAGHDQQSQGTRRSSLNQSMGTMICTQQRKDSHSSACRLGTVSMHTHTHTGNTREQHGRVIFHFEFSQPQINPITAFVLHRSFLCAVWAPIGARSWRQGKCLLFVVFVVLCCVPSMLLTPSSLSSFICFNPNQQSQHGDDGKWEQ